MSNLSFFPELNFVIIAGLDPAERGRDFQRLFFSGRSNGPAEYDLAVFKRACGLEAPAGIFFLIPFDPVNAGEQFIGRDPDRLFRDHAAGDPLVLRPEDPFHTAAVIRFLQKILAYRAAVRPLQSDC